MLSCLLLSSLLLLPLGALSAPANCTEIPTSHPDSTSAAPNTSPALSTPAPCVPPCPYPDALYPNPRDCASFFQCAGLLPVLISCPPNQEYWAEQYRCDWPEVAQCSAGPDTPCEAVTFTTAPPGTGETTHGPTEPVDCKPPCPSAFAYMPHPQDCTKFYECANFIAFENDCPPGLYYNAAMQWCDYPELANCQAGPDHACDELLTP